MLLGPPNSCDALRPSPCTCAEHISIQLLFGQARKVKEHAAKIEKATQTCPVQSLEVQCQNTAL